MADETDTQAGELQPQIVPEEGGEQQEVEQQQDDPVAKIAMDLGWAPKEQFRGNPEDWKPADEFIRAGRDIQRTLSRELREVKDTVTRMSSTSQAILENELRKQEAEILARRTEAIEAGDVEAVNHLDQQRDQLRKPAKDTAAPEVSDFMSRNSWFNRDRVATQVAVAVCDANAHLPEAEQLKLAETEVKRRFPEHFPAPAKPAAEVSQPATRTAGRRGGPKGFNDLPLEAQKVAKDFEMNQGIPKEKYAELYWKKQEQVG